MDTTTTEINATHETLTEIPEFSRNELHASWSSLIEAKSEAEAQPAYTALHAALRSIDTATLMDESVALLDALRNYILARAEELPVDDSTLAAMLRHRVDLRKRFPDGTRLTDGERKEVELLEPAIHAFSNCETPEQVNALFSMIHAYIQKREWLHAIGLKFIARGALDLLIAKQYSARLSSASFEDWRDRHLATMYQMLEARPLGSALRFLHYNNVSHICEIVAPDIVASESNPALISSRILVLFNALDGLDAESAAATIRDYRLEILASLEFWLNTSDCDTKYASAITRSISLAEDEVTAPSREPFPENISMSTLIECAYHGVAGEDAEHEENWTHLLELLESGPGRLDAMNTSTLIAHAARATYGRAVPMPFELLMRLHLALGLFSSSRLNEDDVRAWLSDTSKSVLPWVVGAEPAEPKIAWGN